MSITLIGLIVNLKPKRGSYRLIALMTNDQRENNNKSCDIVWNQMTKPIDPPLGVKNNQFATVFYIGRLSIGGHSPDVNGRSIKGAVVYPLNE